MNKHLAFSALVLFLVAPSAIAAKPTIDVDFNIASGHEYQLAFDGTQINTIRASLKTRIAALLDDTFPPFDFITGPAQHHLTITLEDDPAAAGVTPAVVLMLRMDPAVAPQRTPLKLIFRTDEMRGEPLGSELAFVNDVVKVIAMALESGTNEFVNRLLSTINVTTDVFIQREVKAFVLPFTAEEYEIGDSSRFLVKTTNDAQLPRNFSAEAIGPSPPFTGMPSRFVQRLRISAEREPTANLLATETLHPQAVMLLIYERVRSASAPPSPSAFQTGGSQ